jgi:thiol-disulfide isomerase/thioredoxin
VLGAVVALLAAGCSTFEGTGDLEYVQGDGRIVVVPVDERRDPIDVTGQTVQGDPLSYSDHRGQVMVVNVWGSWCAPCRAEKPMLARAHQRLEAAPDGAVTFVGINIRETSPANAAAFEREYDIDYPSLYDPGSEHLLAFGRHAPYAPPSTVVLDVEGRVAALISGKIPSATTLVNLVEDILAESAGPQAGGAG